MSENPHAIHYRSLIDKFNKVRKKKEVAPNVPHQAIQEIQNQRAGWLRGGFLPLSFGGNFPRRREKQAGQQARIDAIKQARTMVIRYRLRMRCGMGLWKTRPPRGLGRHDDVGRAGDATDGPAAR